MRSDSHAHDDEEDSNDVFLDDSDIIHEVALDDEVLPEASDPNSDSDSEVEEVDDSDHIFTGHTGELYSAACSPTDTALVATGGGDDKGFLWQINNGDWASELNGHTDSVSSLGFSHDGKFLATGSFDGTVKIWDVAGNLKGTLDGPEGGVQWLRWHPRGNVLIVGFDDSSTVWMWNTDSFAFLMSFNGHASRVTCGDFTPDEPEVLVGWSDFYAFPCLDPKSDRIAWIQWSHPNMPWDKSELWVGYIYEKGSFISLRRTRRSEVGLGSTSHNKKVSPLGKLPLRRQQPPPLLPLLLRRRLPL